MDRSGKEIRREVYSDTAALGPALSPDGRTVGVFRYANGNMDLWSFDSVRRLWDRLTVAPGDEIYPLWSADGSRLFLAAARHGQLNIFTKAVNAPVGVGEELLLATPQIKWPMDLSRDGRFLLFTAPDPKTGMNIWALPLASSGVPKIVVGTEFNEQLPQFSPDGRWIAYQSDRSGRAEIYLRPLPGPGPDVLVSNQGGGQPRWNPNGTELFYVAPDDWMMGAAIRRKGDTFEPDRPTRLFRTNIGSGAPNTNRHQYAVAPERGPRISGFRSNYPALGSEV